MTTPRGNTKKLQDVMSRDVATVTPETSLQDAGSLMAEKNVGMLPILAGRELRGTITDRDIVVRAVARGLAPKDTPVSEAMTSKIVTCAPHQTLEDAARTMQEHRLRRMPIVDGEQNLVGIVSIGDVARRSGDAALSGQTLAEVSTHR